MTPVQVGFNHVNGERYTPASESVMRGVHAVQCQSLMGWGALDPTLDGFASLDARMVDVTLCDPTETVLCAWGVPFGQQAGGGTEGWNGFQNYGPATPESFADTVVQTVLRYPNISRVFVGRELGGYWNGATNTYNIGAYTKGAATPGSYLEMYLAVHRAVKAVRPGVFVGGPYPVMMCWSSSKQSNPSEIAGAYGVLDQRPLTAITQWLKGCKAAGVTPDYVVIDGGSTCKDTGPQPVTNDFAACSYFRDATNAVAALGAPPYVWWAETYPSTVSTDPARMAALYATSLAYLLTANVPTRALTWGGIEQSFNTPNLYTLACSALPSAAVMGWFATQGPHDPVFTSRDCTVLGANGILAVDYTTGTVEVP